MSDQAPGADCRVSSWSRSAIRRSLLSGSSWFVRQSVPPRFGRGMERRRETPPRTREGVAAYKPLQFNGLLPQGSAPTAAAHDIVELNEGPPRKVLRTEAGKTPTVRS